MSDLFEELKKYANTSPFDNDKLRNCAGRTIGNRFMALSDDELASRIVNCDRNIKRLVAHAKEKKEYITMPTSISAISFDHVLTNIDYPKTVTLESAVKLVEITMNSLNRHKNTMETKDILTAPNFMNAVFHYNARERYSAELERRGA